MEKERQEMAAIMFVRDAIELILKAKEEKKLLIVIMLWFIWNERNLIREEGCRRSADYVSRCIISYADENTEMLKESGPTVSMSMRRREKRRKPPSDVLELNCDASFLPRSSSGSWGFLIRDNAGDGHHWAGKGRSSSECIPC
jgi:hypothetical protein